KMWSSCFCEFQYAIALPSGEVTPLGSSVCSCSVRPSACLTQTSSSKLRPNTISGTELTSPPTLLTVASHVGFTTTLLAVILIPAAEPGAVPMSVPVCCAAATEPNSKDVEKSILGIFMERASLLRAADCQKSRLGRNGNARTALGLNVGKQIWIHLGVSPARRRANLRSRHPQDAVQIRAIQFCPIQKRIANDRSRKNGPA